MCEESAGDAGATSLGYYGAVFSPDGIGIAANGFTGALHLWQRSGVAQCWLMLFVMVTSSLPIRSLAWMHRMRQ